MEEGKKIIGTTVRSLRAPIIKPGDDIKKIVIDTLMKTGLEFRDSDILTITEAVVARAQNNFATADDIRDDVIDKFKEKEKLPAIGLVFPILSRNRFSVCLKGFARAARKVFVQLSIPGDEVGNNLVDPDLFYERISNIDILRDSFTEKKFKSIFGEAKHPVTNLDYIAYYKNLIKDEGAEAEIIFSNNEKAILEYTKNIVCCDVHSRKRTRKIIDNAAKDIKDARIFSLNEILSSPGEGRGYNEEYGLLGSNKAGGDKVKLFPRDCEKLVFEIQDELKKTTGKTIEVMVYGDGAFKDPKSGIWELADPVVSPGYTDGLSGVPNEIKLKYLADNDFSDLSGEALKQAIVERIKENKESASEKEKLGTTPRNIVDLIGSLSDLTSGSGDKGTPIIYIQGYFDSYC